MNKKVKCVLSAVILIIITTIIVTSVIESRNKANEEINMTNLEFFKSLNYDDGLELTTDIFEQFPLQYATTLGVDGSPQIRPIEFKFEEDGVFYYDTVVFYSTYSELLAHPYIQISVGDHDTMSYLRLGGKVNFTKEKWVIDRCFEESPVLTSQFGEEREMVIAYYLTDVWVEFKSFSSELPNKAYKLTNKYDLTE